MPSNMIVSERKNTERKAAISSHLVSSPACDTLKKLNAGGKKDEYE